MESDGTPASEGQLTNAGRVRVDERGQPWSIEFGFKSLRRIDPDSRTVVTIAGVTPRWLGSSGDPHELLIETIRAVVGTGDGGLICGTDTRLLKLDGGGALHLLAGGDLLCATCRRGEPLPATAAGFLASGIAIGPDGSVYGSARGIKRLRPDGLVEPVTELDHGFAGDNGPAVAARLDNPSPPRRRARTSTRWIATWITSWSPTGCRPAAIGIWTNNNGRLRKGPRIWGVACRPRVRALRAGVCNTQPVDRPI